MYIISKTIYRCGIPYICGWMGNPHDVTTSLYKPKVFSAVLQTDVYIRPTSILNAVIFCLLSGTTRNKTICLLTSDYTATRSTQRTYISGT